MPPKVDPAKLACQIQTLNKEVAAIKKMLGKASDDGAKKAATSLTPRPSTSHQNMVRDMVFRHETKVALFEDRLDTFNEALSTRPGALDVNSLATVTFNQIANILETIGAMARKIEMFDDMHQSHIKTQQTQAEVQEQVQRVLIKVSKKPEKDPELQQIQENITKLETARDEINAIVMSHSESINDQKVINDKLEAQTRDLFEMVKRGDMENAKVTLKRAVNSMAPEHKQALITNRVAIIEDLHVTDVCDHLIQEGIINEEEKENIMAPKVRQDQARILLKYLPTKGPKAFSAFLSLLIQTGQKHIWDQIKSSTTAEKISDISTTKLSSQNQETLLTNISKWMEELDPESVATTLVSAQVLSLQEFGDIKSRDTIEDRNRCLLLKHVIYKGDKGFQVFLEATKHARRDRMKDKQLRQSDGHDSDSDNGKGNARG